MKWMVELMKTYQRNDLETSSTLCRLRFGGLQVQRAFRMSNWLEVPKGLEWLDERFALSLTWNAMKVKKADRLMISEIDKCGHNNK